MELSHICHEIHLQELKILRRYIQNAFFQKLGYRTVEVPVCLASLILR